MTNAEKRKYENLINKRNLLKIRSEQIESEIDQIDEKIDRMEFTEWKRQRQRNKDIFIHDAVADAAQADAIMERAVMENLNSEEEL